MSIGSLKVLSSGRIYVNLSNLQDTSIHFILHQMRIRLMYLNGSSESGLEPGILEIKLSILNKQDDAQVPFGTPLFECRYLDAVTRMLSLGCFYLFLDVGEWHNGQSRHREITHH